MRTTAPMRHRFETANFDKAHALLGQRWVRHTATLRSDRADFGFVDTTLDLGALVSEYIEYRGVASVGCEPFGEVVIGHLHGGTAAVSVGDQEVRLGAGEVACFPPDRPHRFEVAEPEVSYLRLDQAALGAVADELTGSAGSGPRFESMRPVSDAHQRHWLTVLCHINRDVLARDEVLANPIIRAETFRHLVVTALATFPNTALASLSDPHARTGQAEPAVLRRAIEFIESRAHEPIGLGEIARAARISPRGLQREFRRHRDTTPLGYLRRVRLERTHRDLAAADPSGGDSVAAIAARWGFAHTGRFAAEYQSVYGTRPSQTLRR